MTMPDPLEPIRRDLEFFEEMFRETFDPTNVASIIKPGETLEQLIQRSARRAVDAAREVEGLVPFPWPPGLGLGQERYQ